jgi:ribosomal protein S18 acetylase RimI-like enzyme
MVSEDIVIRQARLEDADILIRFSAAMAWETERRELDRERLRQGTLAVFDRADRGTFYVAEHRPGHVVIGQCLITYEWSDWRNAQFWWIQSVYVDPQWRRRGVYRRLHDSIRQRAQTTPGVCGIRLYVEQNNMTAQDAYRRAGLRRSGYLIFEEDFVYSSHSLKESP